MDKRPIGVFDSGLGGLTAVHSLQQLLPGEDIVYFGDTARVPYGGRTKETLLSYALQDVRFLRSFDLKAILVACGTLSTTTLPGLRAANELPILGVVDAACRKAAAVTRSRKIGVIATQASIRSGAYEAGIRALAPSAEVLGQGCPLLAPLVENGRIHRGDVVIETVVREYLEPLLDRGIDTLVLGCTHYPVLTEIIQEICGEGVELVSASAEAAAELGELLKQRELLSAAESGGSLSIYVSDRPEEFERMAAVVLQSGLDRAVRRIDIDQY